MQHIVDWSRGKSYDARKACNEALIIGNDRNHLRLLQHDFRDPHSIGCALLLPGQIVAATARMPLDERGSYSRVGALHSANSINGRAPFALPAPEHPKSGNRAWKKCRINIRGKKDAAGIVLERGSRAPNRRRAWSTLVGGHSWTLRRHPRLR